MLNGAASCATRRSGIAGVGQDLAERGLARHRPERRRAGWASDDGVHTRVEIA